MLKSVVIIVIAVVLFTPILFTDADALNPKLEDVQILERYDDYLVSFSANLNYEMGYTAIHHNICNYFELFPTNKISSESGTYRIKDCTLTYGGSHNHVPEVFFIISATVPKEANTWKFTERHKYNLDFGTFTTPKPVPYEMGKYIPVNNQKTQFGDFSISKIIIFEKEYYDVLSFHVDVKVPLSFDQYVAVDARDVTILSEENGKRYSLGAPECGTIHNKIGILGTEGGMNDFGVCYRIDKELNEVKIMFGDRLIDKVSIDNIKENQSELEVLQNSIETNLPNADGGGCLIATATYGSEMVLEVQQLRELRDNTLLQTESGTSFMGMFNEIYYSFSPYIADMERENPVFKEMVKLAITPMISSLSILNYVEMDSESSVLGYGISLILLNLGMYLGVPAVVIVGIRKRF